MTNTPDTGTVPRGSNRWTVAAAVMAGLAWGILALMATDHAFWERVQGLFLWPNWPPFDDFETLRKGLRAWAAGVDPLRADLASTGLSYNYPRAWLWGGFLFLEKIPLAVEGLVLAALFLGTIWLILRPRRFGMFAVMAIVLVSPPTRLLLERCNIDIVIFLLIAAGAGLGLRTGRVLGPCIGVLALMMAAILKLYPLAPLALGAAVEHGCRRWIFAIGAIAAGLFLATRVDELKLISSRTPRPQVAAYGSAVLADRLALHAHQEEFPPLGKIRFERRRIVSSCVFALGAGGVFFWGLARRRQVGVPAASGREWKFFLPGAAIYCGTFLLGNNWSYRLVFLIFCIPFLGSAAKNPGWGRITFAALLLTLCAPSNVTRWPFALLQADNWMLGLLLAAAIGAGGFGALKTPD